MSNQGFGLRPYVIEVIAGEDGERRDGGKNVAGKFGLESEKA